MQFGRSGSEGWKCAFGQVTRHHTFTQRHKEAEGRDDSNDRVQVHFEPLAIVRNVPEHPPIPLTLCPLLLGFSALKLCGPP